MSGSIFVNDFSQHAPDCPIECGEPAVHFDEVLMRRIGSALQRSLALSTKGGEDVWTSIIAKHQNVVDLMIRGDLTAANDIFARMFASPLTFGFEQWDELHAQIVAQPNVQQHVRQFAFDKLLSLAAFLRAIPVQTVEQGNFVPFLQQQPDMLLDGIEKKIQREIRAPHFQGGLFGLKTKRGLFSERNVTAIYVALRLKELLSHVSNPRICEIGGGTGFVAYYCRWLGLTDYTIVDLPTVNMVQAYFLAQNLGADRISLAGEPASPDRIKIVSAPDFAGLEFDMIVNVDSFPEMSGHIMREYLGRGGFRFLLSINQEAMAARTANNYQERVGDVIDEIGGFRRLARFPFWMRPGYVEEVYENAASANSTRSKGFQLGHYRNLAGRFVRFYRNFIAIQKR